MKTSKYQPCELSSAHRDFLAERHIRCATVCVPEEELSSRLSELSVSEREACTRLPVTNRAGFVASRIAARALWEESGSISHDERVIDHRDNGTPFFVGLAEDPERKNFRFLSLSHAGQRAVAVTGPCPLGVDVEYVRSYDATWAEAFLTPHELESVHQVAQKGLTTGAALTAYWCAKEAYLKATGEGLRLHPKEVFCYIDWHTGRFEMSRSGSSVGQGRVCFSEQKYVTALAIIE